MIKQAHTYLVGALSGVTLIGIAIAVFVVLVSAQVFQELPVVNVSNPEHKASAVSPAKALSAGGRTITATTGGTTAKVARSHGGANGTAIAAVPTGGNAGNRDGNAAGPGAEAGTTGPATVVEGSPSASGDGTKSSGGNSGSHASQPSRNSPSQSPSSSTESGSTSSTSSGTSGSTGSSTAAGSTGSSGSGSGSSGSTGGAVTATTKPPPSQEIEETVDGVVGGVDDATGGALGQTGITGVVESVAGPESVVGKTVDGVTEALNGLLGSGSP